VPYRGTPQVIQDLVAGQVDIVFEQVSSSLPQAMPQTPGGTAISVRHAYAVAASGLISTA
jgi:hypothetical protein